jgi:hypothetical protein
MLDRQANWRALALALGPALGATAGALLGLYGGDRGSQLSWGTAVGVVLTQYLTLVWIAVDTGRSPPRAIVAALISGPVVLFVLVGLTLAVTVAVFGVGMAVPVAAVLTAIYRLPALSFMRAWPGEVIAAVTMPFVVLWWMLLERVIDVWDRREARRSRRVEVRPPRRAGQAVQGALRTVPGALRAMLDFIGGVVDRLRRAEGPVGRWVVVPRTTTPFVLAFLASAFPFAGLVLVDSLVFGYDYAASHRADAVAATIGAVVGGLYGACMSFVGAVAAGLDEP